MIGADPPRPATGARADGAAAPTPSFDEVYRRYFHACCRWLRALGAPESDLDDLAQEVFLVVRRRLGDEVIENLPAWIYRISARTFSDHRRRAWWKNLFSRRGTLPRDVPSTAPGPAEHLETAERARLACALLDRLSPKHRAAFVLFEIEGYGGDEIAALENVPLKTVWTRLHHARKRFLALAEAERRRQQRRRRRRTDDEEEEER